MASSHMMREVLKIADMFQLTSYGDGMSQRKYLDKSLNAYFKMLDCASAEFASVLKDLTICFVLSVACSCGAKP